MRHPSLILATLNARLAFNTLLGFDDLTQQALNAGYRREF